MEHCCPPGQCAFGDGDVTVGCITAVNVGGEPVDFVINVNGTPVETVTLPAGAGNAPIAGGWSVAAGDIVTIDMPTVLTDPTAAPSCIGVQMRIEEEC